MDTVTFIHMSDLHLGSFGPGDPDLLSDTRATLDATVAEVRRLSPPPSFAVLSGDLSNRGDADSYRALAQATAALPCPAIHALGNHDDRAGYREALAPGSGPACGDHLIDGVHVVVLDTLVPGLVSGTIDEDQFAWLEGAMARHAEAPKLVVMHHPPAIGGAEGWDTIDRASTGRLAALLRGHAVAAILSGHVHLDRVSVWEGLPVVTVSGLHAASDPLHGDGLRALRGASFGLCRLGPGGFSVTFVQAPSDRAELGLYTAAELRAMSA